MQTVTVNEARKNLDELIERAQKTGLAITIVDDSQKPLVYILPAVQPAYYYKNRPVYTSEQMKNMPRMFPDESEWVSEILAKQKDQNQTDE